MRCAVLGDPVAHSLSPVLHRAAYAELGLDWEYDAVRVPAGGLAEFVAGLGDDVRGLSLTMPLKREAIRLADRVSSRASLVGAANTLVRDEDALFADNTDLPGAVAALRERHDGPVTSATVLGAGATAASTGLALVELGATRVVLLARDSGRAAETRAVVASHPSAPEVVVADLATAPVEGEVVVSTVPAAAQSEELVARVGEVPVLFEVVYDPWPTPLARSATGVVVGGLDLLVHQAVHQVELFTSRPAPLAAMRAAGERALAARGRLG
ncbi:shikimate dehydrogenase [Nocardioides sp. SYSU D00038]|uniref:shikimate dehydrogenase n=1 Tax=Nocardioides sp. SYSU D00038 TaxID=2812554 RepID=UPI001968253C|nr:shikimate dehydrogenase [Nocardioides sp. SYSU D00038]